jgi:EmrB/QacA subfamily drug resistance transporter
VFPSAGAGAAAPTRTRLGWSLVLLALAQLIFSLDINIVYVALPGIGAELGFSEQTQQLVISAYVVFAGGFLLLGGRAADLLGRRRVFVLALAVYAVSSLLGGLAWSPTTIVVARAAQGIGGALLLPSMLSLLNTLFAEGPARNRALAVWGGAGASGLTLGALLGGVLTDAFGWPAVFFVNVPLAGLVALAALVVIPPAGRRDRDRRFDLPGALTATGGATLLVYALVQGPEVGWTSTDVLAALIAGVALLAAFVVVERRSRDPLAPPRLFGNRSLVVGMLSTAIYMATFGALPYFLTVLLQTVHRFDPLQTGLGFLVPSVAILIGTQLGERVTNRVGVRTALLIGFTTGALGTAAMLPGFDARADFAILVPGLLVSGLGQGIAWTAMWIVAGSGVAPEQQGVANGLASTTLNVGNAVGLAVLIAIANVGVIGPQGERSATATADGGFAAIVVAALGMLVGGLVTLALPRKPPRGNRTRETPAAADPPRLSDYPRTMAALPTTDQIELDQVLTALGHPVRLAVVRALADGEERACGSVLDDPTVSKSTLTHHWRVLRNSGVINQRPSGRENLLSLRRDDLEHRFPGLITAVLAGLAATGVGSGADPG